MLRRWFDDQDFIVVFNFFECLRDLGNIAKIFACFVDLEKVQYDCLSNLGGFCRRITLMVSSYMPLKHFTVPTGVSWLSEWQAIKASPIRH